MTTEHKVIGGGIAVTLIILAGGLWLSEKKEAENSERLSRPMMGEKIPDLGSIHVDRGEAHPEYNSNPPTSGWHFGDGVAGPGVKTSPVPDELVLHSMEHGAVVVWYREGLEQSEVDKVTRAFNVSSGKKILLSRKDLDVPVALTSWNYLLKLETIDEQKIQEFIETNNDRAPEKAPI
ncbi:MAG: hypothetical protein COV91_06215 [Candidatus Taylorbacteria bacterium CG11_big_fil_rev_8_21_14_0_20_46_11]|uniref:DUF3105 domain-containing protein n=1 Tax=Candidatus Taylorbacteria bacterium CG11_big_fil_rev_8_21_14_0_20_46_11 TaxID=1975025 RepID=A0A2H0K9Z0_9BACT|nr:MAG: hypothetical protein COV91_06215 [Candidatus Taylorbacteria bacterium CG11_big_fil_rev_8_21_14_0_20_46_11]